MSARLVVLQIDGLPQPQGSKTIAKRGGKVWLRDSNARELKQWRAKVATTADIGVTFTTPTLTAVTFWLPRPKRPRWLFPGVKPDLDKLQRALFDGLADGGLIENDSRVTSVLAFKRYADEREPGASVIVMEDSMTEKCPNANNPYGHNPECECGWWGAPADLTKEDSRQRTGDRLRRIVKRVTDDLR